MLRPSGSTQEIRQATPVADHSSTVVMNSVHHRTMKMKPDARLDPFPCCHFRGFARQS
jgi:hypothetical protein